METTLCPHCRNEAGFDPSTGEVICESCGVLEPPSYELQMNVIVRDTQSKGPLVSVIEGGLSEVEAMWLERLLAINRKRIIERLAAYEEDEQWVLKLLNDKGDEQ